MYTAWPHYTQSSMSLATQWILVQGHRQVFLISTSFSYLLGCLVRLCAFPFSSCLLLHHDTYRNALRLPLLGVETSVAGSVSTFSSLPPPRA
ncbi:hypothetical protein BD309DRAFT_973803 [Dichomitus squalens]|nr:hypothetical protein BD309DRAFT_973803 [Dichomitus squalens]